MDFSFASGFLDEVKHAAVFLVAEAHQRVVGSSPSRENTEQAPGFNTFLNKEVADFGQMGIVALVDAGDYIELDKRFGHQQVKSLTGSLETLMMATHPVVVVGQSVDAEGYGIEVGIEKPAEPFGGEQKSVGDHAPGETALMESASAFLQIGAHQRFAAGYDDKDFRRIGIGGYVVEHAEEVFLRHVGSLHDFTAVTPAMAAVHIAAQRALPEQLTQRVTVDDVTPDDAFHLERHALFQL